MAGETVLIVNHDPRAGEAVADGAAALGVEARVFRDLREALRFGERNRFNVAVVDAEQAGERIADWCGDLRRRYGRHGNVARSNAESGRELPILALTDAKRVGDAERLFLHGVSDCLPKSAAPERLAWKLDRWLKSVRVDDEDEGLGPVPEHLRRCFENASRNGQGMRAAADIYSGVTVRQSAFKRMAPPSGDWLGVLDAASLGEFRAGEPSAFFKFAPEALFRMPDSEEYVPEKVLLRRVAPPLVAAIDVNGHPFGGDVLGLVARPGYNNGFLACLLNSRLAQFWFNRLWERGVRRGATQLTGMDLDEFPVAAPGPNDLEYFRRAAKLLRFYGPRPASVHDRGARARLWREVNERLFDLYGFDEEARRLLAELYF